MIIRTLSATVVATVLAGCTSAASGMTDCEAQVNTAKQYAQSSRYRIPIVTPLRMAVQHAQKAKSKTLNARISGIDIKILPGNKQAYIEQTAATLTEEDQYAQVYQQGEFTAIWYRKKQQIVLLHNGQFVDTAKG